MEKLQIILFLIVMVIGVAFISWAIYQYVQIGKLEKQQAELQNCSKILNQTTTRAKSITKMREFNKCISEFKEKWKVIQ
jgi:predicted negative regulator of RcsB-dependent stress response